MNFFRFTRLSQKIVQKVKILDLSNKLVIPEKWKGGRWERWGLYWRDMFYDYKGVASDVIEGCKKRPRKAFAISTGIFLMLAAIQTNPDEQEFHDQLVNSVQNLLLVSRPIQNPIAESHTRLLTSCENLGVLRRTNLLFFSLMWIDDYDSECKLYAAQCSYLRPEILRFYRHIIDFGIYGRWQCLQWKMSDYDINPNEWKVPST